MPQPHAPVTEVIVVFPMDPVPMFVKVTRAEVLLPDALAETFHPDPVIELDATAKDVAAVRALQPPVPPILVPIGTTTSLQP